MKNIMDFLPAFLGTGLFVVVGVFLGMVAYGAAYLCGVPFDLGRFAVSCALGGWLGTVLLLWAEHATTYRRSADEKTETVIACLLWWAVLAGLTFLWMLA